MKKIKSPWDFSCPPYDERSSNFVNAGWNHGIGKAQPIGSDKHNSKQGIPIGRGPKRQTDQTGKINLPIDLEQ